MIEFQEMADQGSSLPPSPKRQRSAPSSSGEAPPTIANPLPPPSTAATTVPLPSSSRQSPQEPPRPERITLGRRPVSGNPVQCDPRPQQPPLAVANGNPLSSSARQPPRGDNPNMGHQRAILRPLPLQQQPPAHDIGIPPLGRNPFPRGQPLLIMADVRERGPLSTIRIRDSADGSERIFVADPFGIDYHFLNLSNEPLMIYPTAPRGRMVGPSSSAPMAPNMQLAPRTNPHLNPNYDFVAQAARGRGTSIFEGPENRNVGPYAPSSSGGDGRRRRFDNNALVQQINRDRGLQFLLRQQVTGDHLSSSNQTNNEDEDENVNVDEWLNFDGYETQNVGPSGANNVEAAEQQGALISDQTTGRGDQRNNGVENEIDLNQPGLHDAPAGDN